MSPSETLLILSIIVEMMVIGFGLIFYLFRHKEYPSRIVGLILGALVLISSVSVAISNVYFWGGSAVTSLALIAVSAVIFLSPLLSKGKKIDWRKSGVFSMYAVAVLVYYEMAMGFFYGSAFLPHSLSLLTLTVDNIDFSIMMAIDAVFFFLVLRDWKSISGYALFTFALSMSLMPNFYFDQSKPIIITTAVVSSIVMVVNVVLLYKMQFGKKDYKHQSMALILSAMDFLMMIGLALFAVYHDLRFMSAAMILSMAAYFVLVTYKVENRKIKHHLFYSFSLLVLINAAELAMSLGVTSLGFMITNGLYPSAGVNTGSIFSTLSPGMTGALNFSNPFWWIFPFDPGMMSIMAFHKGLSVGVPFAYFWSSFMLIMMITMSPFYAIMMGSEMSYLVLDRYRISKNRRVKNWAIAIIAGIPLFVVLIPFYSPFYIFGMSGMLFSVPLILFLVSVAAIIIASILLGRKAQCNTVCMAAHMWTNSYYDQFKPTKDHKILWEIVRWISFGIMIVAFAVFALQQAHIMGPLKIGMIMINPLVFYGMFVLNYVWWFFYFLTPVFGTYSCARQGWCGFGTLAGIFNKFFFKIKPIDLSVCESCETKSCQVACPTSIPLTADFSKKGFSNRISCVGCGNCLESCEMDNLDMVDLLSSIRKGGKQINPVAK